MQYEFRPIDEWPGEPTPHGKRQKSQFSAPWSKTIDLLDRELGFLKATSVVIQADVSANEIRLDGMLYANSRPRSPRVVLSFDSKHGPLSYPCDRYTDWQANVRAIALALEALRAVDRYGVTRRAEQYKGWEKLPAPATNGQAAIKILAQFSGLPPADVQRSPEAAYRAAVSKTHPDTGGLADDFKAVQEAWEALP